MKKSSSPSEQEPTPTPIKKGIVYISRLPYGFDDKAAFAFFPQFGEVKGVCFPRNKKTGRSKGYMFVLFEDRDVAKIAAKTMDGYVMIGKQLKATVIEAKTGSKEMQKFKATHSKFKFVPWKLLFRNRFNKAQDEEAMKRKMKKLLEGDEKKRKKLKALGIDFNFGGYQALL